MKASRRSCPSSSEESLGYKFNRIYTTSQERYCYGTAAGIDKDFEFENFGNPDSLETLGMVEPTIVRGNTVSCEEC